MPKSYYALKDEQMIITFTDLEGDYEFLKRSLSLYKQIYQKTFPKSSLKNEDFTVTGGDYNQYICYPSNVICVNAGDLTDKTRSNTGRTENYNMRLVRLINHTHQQYKERMFSILGNRETTKLRMTKEFNIQFIENILRQEIELPIEKQDQTGADRKSNLVWVDNRKKTFLRYLQENFKLENNQLVDTFMQLNANKKIILYAKWMLANSCGAPDLWNDIAGEANINDEDMMLQLFHDFFSDKDGDYVKYLNNCQIGVQIGNILFTHSGIHDNSFILPKTLFALLTTEELRQLFTNEYNNLVSQEEPIASNIYQLLEALNAWFFKINRLRFTTNPELKKLVDLAIDELILMGLPPTRNNQHSVINLPVTNSNGAYGISLNPSNHDKLLNLAESKPVYISYHGHSAAKLPRYAKTVTYCEEEKPMILQRIDGDTCNNRRNNAAVGIAFKQNKKSILIESEYIDENSKRIVLNWPGRTVDGELCDKNSNVITESNPDFYIGAHVEQDGEPGWNIISYRSEDKSFELHKQNNKDYSSKIIHVDALSIMNKVRETTASQQSQHSSLFFQKSIINKQTDVPQPENKF